MTLTPRQQTALSAVVGEYLRTGQSVGSARLRDMMDGQYSSATLRADLHALCESGYLAQPHTSAGRVPTDAGLRFFVDQLAPPAPAPGQEQWLEDLVHQFEGSLGIFLEALSEGLAKTSGLLALVAVQTTHSATIEHVDLSFVNSREVLLVLGLRGGQPVCTRLRLDLPIDRTLVTRVAQNLRHRLLDEPLTMWDTTQVEDLIESIALDERLLMRQALTKIRSLLDTGAVTRRVHFSGLGNLLHHLPGEVVSRVSEQLVPQIYERLGGGPPTSAEVLIGTEMTLPPLAPLASVRTLSDPAQGVRCMTLLLGPRRLPYAEAMGLAALGTRWSSALSLQT